MAEKSVTLNPGESKVVTFEAIPSEEGTYQVSVDGLSGSFIAKPEVELITFTLEVFNIPAHAKGAHQWYVRYGGKNYGVVESLVWTPIDTAITVEDAPASGTLEVTLMEEALKQWVFRVHRTFRDGETYRFNLEAGFIEGPGIAVRDLVIEPDYLTAGEEASISVTAVNSGVSEESHEVLFSLQKYEDSAIVGSPITQRGTVTLAPGESKLVTIKVTPEAGRYLVSVEGLTGWLEAVEPYPPIASPEIVSIEWVKLPKYNSPYASFKGTILLPAPGKKQYYILFFNMGGTELNTGINTYLGDGLWAFGGEAQLPFRNYPNEFCCCRSGEPCYQTVIGEWIVPSCPDYFYSRIPCPGTELGLNLRVELWETYISGIYTTARKVKGWRLDSGLTWVVDQTM